MSISTNSYYHIQKLAEEKLLPVFFPYINDSISLIEKASDARLKYLSSLGSTGNDNLNLHLEINKHLNKFVSSHSAFDRIKESEELFEVFIKEAGKYLSELPDQIVEEQLPERFVAQPEDNFTIKFYKFFKSKLFIIARIPFYIKNFISKTFKKQQKTLQYWHHKVPVKSVTKYHLFEEFLTELIPIASKLFSELNKNIAEFWKADQEFDYKYFDVEGSFTNEFVASYKAIVKQCIQNIQNLKQNLKKDLDLLLKKQHTIYENNLLKVGTIELPLRKYSLKKINKSEKDRKKNFNNSLTNWASATLLLKSDWVQDIELMILRGEFIKESENLKSSLDNFIKDEINPILIEFRELFSNASREVSNSVDPFDSITKVRENLIEKLNNSFNKRFDAMIESENTGPLLDKFELLLEEKMSIVSDNLPVSNSDDYTKEISAASVNYISMREIIHLEILPTFSKVIKELKSEVFNKFNDFRKTLFDIEQIVDFTLEAALELNQENEPDDSDPVKVVQRGIGRALDKNDKLIKDVEQFSVSFFEKYNSSFSVFLKELMELTVNENILKLKLIIVKAKAIKKARGFGKVLLSNTIDYLKKFTDLVSKGYAAVKSEYQLISKKYGLTKTSGHIASEASDFLADTNRALEKLPYIYRRLFNVEPLKDERLFAVREAEYSELMKAYKNWLRNKFAPVIFVGEKGSGITTIFNIALKSVQNKEIFRTSLNRIIYKPDDFLDFLSTFLKAGKFKSKDDVINYLNSSEQKRIIILENIQHLYLRTVGGFESLKLLFSVISATNKKVFWVTSTTIYSWDYLKKTISISEYFAYLIKLRQMSNQQIIELIDKRHRISGFDLQFEMSEEMKQNKSLSKSLNNKSQQEISEILKKAFYNKLTKFAGSNISLALLYWMRAAKDFKGSTLIMNPDLEIDVSFLANIREEKLFILHSLILHDGIDIDNLSITTGYDNESCKLIVMQLIDDGILQVKDENYVVNPLVYRQLTTILKHKNILH